MKLMRATVFIASAIMLASCSGRWSGEEQQVFTQSCIASETARGTSTLTARAYCECALDKISKRYATTAEAKQNKDSTAMALDLEICRRSTR